MGKSFESVLVRLAYANPELRADILPMLKGTRASAGAKDTYLVTDLRRSEKEFPSLAQAKAWVKESGMPSGGPKSPRWRGPSQPGDGHGNAIGPKEWSSDDTDYFILLIPPGAPPEWRKNKHKPFGKI